VLAPRVRYRLVWACVSVLLVVNSRSATSLALVFVTLGSAAFSLAVRQFNSKRKQRFIIAFLSTVAGAFALSVVLDASFAAGLLGRDGTLTGRTAIWDFVWRRIKERPWLGHGYQAYWNVENEFTINIKRTVGFPVTSAHQGLLDVLLGVGIIGLVIVSVMLGTAILRTFGDRHIPGRERVSPRLMLWARGIVLIYSIETFSESCLTTVFVVPLLMVISAIASETTFFQRRSTALSTPIKSALNI
jgi:exopolysaccharide production protein ExoQ